ncbi:MAG: endopeptidase La [Gemmatimonadales bacterium]|nr:MAG: endopeptidase La [Gemmatimonadales bacterium]
MTPLPERLPVLPLRDLVFFPSMVLPLLVGRPRSTAALEEAETTPSGLLLLLTQRDPETEDPGAADLHRIGTVVRVVQSSGLADGTVRVVFEGVARAIVDRFVSGSDSLRARVHAFPYPDAVPDPDDRDSGSERVARLRRVERRAREYVHLHPDLPDDLAEALGGVEDPVRLVHRIAGHLIVGAAEKQEFLECETLDGAVRALHVLLERELEIMDIERRLDREIRERMGVGPGDEFLQEQLRSMQQGMEADEEDWAELQSRIEAAELPAPARERADRELNRLRRLNPASPESGVIRGYLDWILALPWALRSTDLADVARARELLEAAHYGLDEVKDRILDHIAVLSLVGELQGPILCLVGPPGVGKTSLGQSIAEALGRGFVRISLGGVRDEAEIRGHRRTYVGSLPGRILQGMRRAGTRNPVFLLDEVDKLTRDAHGDPAAALLEVLDPEQNRTFQDHYLELDFDLSDVLFVATANSLQGIPDALRDRMEIIRIPGYLDTEKREIARAFLVPSQLRRHGFSPDRFRLQEAAAGWLIENYTREAGVRELDRCLARVARKLARDVAEGQRDPDEGGEIDQDQLRRLLGPPPLVRTERDGGPGRVGIATGLAWTSAGGELLEVEVAVVPGQGAIQLTGTLGDVMKESAVAALTFARSRARLLGLEPRFHRDVDVHIHMPEGATPKDGPSAGSTIALALISALTGRPTRRDVAMTGEITLRGRILPVGGMKEKSVAALRGGLTTILIPVGNEPDIQRLPAEVRERLEIRTVTEMDEVLEYGLEGGAGWLGQSGGTPPGALHMENP